MAQGWLNVLLLVPIFLFSLSVHEFAHGWMAVKRGDNTPILAGRLSLHPLAHADFIGTLALPILCIYYGWPFFGWAKPVPIDVRNLKYGRRDMALVAAAGPASNIILAILGTVLLAVLVRIESGYKVLETVKLFTVVSMQVNLALAFFNLLPIPPLDGFNIFQVVLPGRFVAKLLKYAPAVNILLLVLLMSGGLGYLGRPIGFCFRWLINLAAGGVA
ncbi:MAG: site-2 protease family protein [Deltaproteobacteria bacterium]|nr:site-2 protease family protein [Deltaproteobacteria bacterium]MBI3294716.1 site-2 protease family protein [Deltaproteobacteria bacterium]